MYLQRLLINIKDDIKVFSVINNMENNIKKSDKFIPLLTYMMK